MLGDFMPDRVGRRGILGGLLAAGAGGAKVHAADWPTRPVTWVVPFPTGGESDQFARPVAERVSRVLRQPVNVDNRGGFGGALGTNLVAIAPPDGYTMLVGYTGLCYAPLIYPQAGFDLGRSFVPVSALARVPSALVVNAGLLGISDLKQFIDMAKQKPRTISVASSGVGTVSHLAIGLLEARAGIQLKHVAYRGLGGALQELLAGQVSASFIPVSSILEHVGSRKLRVLAIAAQRREALLPDVPTFADAGITDFRVSTWYGLFAPKDTPDPILERTYGAVQLALGEAEVKKIWAEAGAKVELETRADFSRFVDREIITWGHIAKEANIKLE